MIALKSLTRLLQCSRWALPRHIIQAHFSTGSEVRLCQQKLPPQENSKPIKFFGSQASRWSAERSRTGNMNEEAPWYQPYVVNLSVFVFLIYFCILREENDIDDGLQRSLFDHVPGLEERQLALTYQYNQEHGLPTGEIERRMTELGLGEQEKL